MVSKTMYNEIRQILEPCCVPSFTFSTYSCDSTDAAWGIVFQDVTISAPALANMTVKVILMDDSTTGGGVINNVTFDSVGSWTGDLQSSWWNSDGSQTIYPYILTSDSRVIYTSPAQSLTSLPNCD